MTVTAAVRVDPRQLCVVRECQKRGCHDDSSYPVITWRLDYTSPGLGPIGHDIFHNGVNLFTNCALRQQFLRSPPCMCPCGVHLCACVFLCVPTCVCGVHLCACVHVVCICVHVTVWCAFVLQYVLCFKYWLNQVLSRHMLTFAHAVFKLLLIMLSSNAKCYPTVPPKVFGSSNQSSSVQPPLAS